MNTNLPDLIKQAGFKGEIKSDAQTLAAYSRDSSIFEITPEIVVFPNDVEDIKTLVKFTNANKDKIESLSLTPRAAGTCMSAGTVNNSIIVSTTQHLNNLINLNAEQKIVTCQPGLFYRDLEKELDKHELLLPPYTSSKRLCTVGGMVANNAGGEKSLGYGKTEKYVENLKVILEDGQEYEIKKLNRQQMQEQIEKDDTLGKIYKTLFELFEKNSDLIQKHRPKVTKNSAGYTIWDVWDGQNFDAPKLFVGSQGTLGIITEITLNLVKKKKNYGILMAFMQNYDHLPEIVSTVLSHKPDCFESFDHYTYDLALKYVTGFSRILNLTEEETVKAFHPEFARAEKDGTPELTLLIEYENDDPELIRQNLQKLSTELKKFDNITTYMTHDQAEREKYWAMRRESFGLLKSQVKGKYAAPFIDDVVVETSHLPEFFPKLYKLLNDSKFMYTVAGHIGNGNFHIIPLVEMETENISGKIYDMMDKVFELVWEYNGSDSGEHNDGIVRAPYLKQQFGEEIYSIFEQIKNVFDPKNIFNPHKKVNVTKEYAQKYMIKSSTPLSHQITFTK